jgi:hypothetical protein
MFKIACTVSVALFLISSNTVAQPDLSYFLPENIEYNSAIPTPRSIIGHDVGELHVTHDKLIEYMRTLDAASDRISLEITGYTHEDRPLILLTITDPANHQNIESIRKQHLQLSDPSKSGSLNTGSMPGVFYLGCSIHGNEPSGSNAAMLIAYHLAAAKGNDIQNTLKNTIILLDPSFNPDGLQRFSSWVNSRKSKSVNADPNDMEHNEAWPTGRTNHYWFDLNRDWLVAQQPESQARVKKFHEWKPNLLTDHHEMMTNFTFFFQPGVPSRNHPLTPLKNYELTYKIGTYHAKALDAIGSLYYTQEGFDDFYHGKGSSFPDVQGGIGILFEQASSRGHAQESPNGVLRFPFTIRNQFTTMLSSLKAVTEMREELLDYQRQFFKDAQADAAKDPVKAIVFGGTKDKVRSLMLAEIFLRHDISIYRLPSTLHVNGKKFDLENSFVIPMQQSQYRLIKSMTEKRTKFQDSLFYDISSWTLPLAAGVDYEELKTLPALSDKVTSVKFPPGKKIGNGTYAFVFESYGFYAPRAINRLLRNGVRCKVASEQFYYSDGKKFDRGSILIPPQDGLVSYEVLQFLIKTITSEDGIDVYAFETGLDYKGTSLGSNSFMLLRKPEIAMLVDGGVSSGSAGEIWHMLDVRFNIPVTLIPISVFNSVNINRYNTIIFPAGAYTLTEAAKEKLKSWAQGGGVAIGFENALTWLTACGFGKFDMKKTDEAKDITKPAQPYAEIDNAKGAQETSGAIFEVRADLSHPLLYGYDNSRLAVFKGNNFFMEQSKNAFGNPVVFSSSPLLSGYMSKDNLAKLSNASYVGVSSLGKGRVIGFTESLAFRAFWFGTNKMLMNAILYGHLINEGSAR